jgi:hypothetical protein
MCPPLLVLARAGLFWVVLARAGLFWAVLARADLFNLRDTARPGLVVGESNDKLAWWDGGPAYVLASSGAVRINFRGLYTYPPSAIVRDLRAVGWHGVPCNASAWALCSSDAGQVMPASGARMPEKQELVTAEGWDRLGCSRSDGKVLLSLGVYDISACDVLDEGLDLVYSPGMVYHRHNAMQTWKYWLLVVLALVLVRFLSFNVQILWDPKASGQPKRQGPALVCCLAVLAVVLVDADALQVTSADQVFFWSTIGYILVYLGMHAAARHSAGQQDAPAEGPDMPVYNVLVASLQLVAGRFYSAAETPYNLVLIGILACRTW